MKDARARVAARIRHAIAQWEQRPVLAEIRAGLEELMAGPVPGRISETEIAGMPAAIHAMPEAPRDRVILFCHGGGFQIGSLRSHASLMARIAEASGVSVIGIDYRLAPESRFPAAHEDCFSAYKTLLEEGYAPGKIIVAGDSAGGSLALGVALQAREAGLPMPAGLVLISAWLDLKMRGESYISRAEQDIFSRTPQLKAMVRTYLGRGVEPDHPLVTPVDADLTGLPPILIHAGDFDITRDDSTLFATRAQAAGVDVTLKIWPEMMHHFQVFAELPEAQESLADIGDFIKNRVG